MASAPRPAAMLSAAADFGTVLAAVNRAGVFRYIPKPWSEPQLMGDLSAALAFDPCAAPSADELLALSRKFIVLGSKATGAETIAALALATLVLGVVYWLLLERENRLPKARGTGLGG
jgi:hypothetical protein